MPKGIDEAGIEKALETSPFLGGETVRLDVFLGAGEVDCGVCTLKSPPHTTGLCCSSP